MHIRSFVTGLAFAVMAAGVAVTPAEAASDQLGAVWREKEGDYDGVWTRRGSSNIFDAVWKQRWTEAKVTAVLTINIKGNTVSIQRRNGTNISYTGTIGGDGVTVTGTAQALPNGTPWRWEAKIVGGTGSPSGATATPSPSPVALNLTGPWVHSADPTFKTHDSKVIVIQDGAQVSITRTWKHNGRWIVSVCRGTLSGNKLQAACAYAPGGNPFGFSDTKESWTVSPDGNHLDGTIGGGQESHYSRIP